MSVGLVTYIGRNKVLSIWSKLAQSFQKYLKKSLTLFFSCITEPSCISYWLVLRFLQARKFCYFESRKKVSIHVWSIHKLIIFSGLENREKSAILEIAHFTKENNNLSNHVHKNTCISSIIYVRPFGWAFRCSIKTWKTKNSYNFSRLFRIKPPSHHRLKMNLILCSHPRNRLALSSKITT